MKIQSWDGCFIRSILISAALALALTGCGGGGGGTDTGTVTGTTSYTVGGTVSGLVGSVVLGENISGNNLTVKTNGTYTFTVQVASGSPYYITVLTQPAGQTCTISGGTGIISGNVNNVAVACTDNPYTVGGSVTGLTGSVMLQDNGGDDLTISADGPFTFATTVADGSTYKVTVFTQPTTRDLLRELGRRHSLRQQRHQCGRGLLRHCIHRGCHGLRAERYPRCCKSTMTTTLP